ncbi:MAG: hypothetical protein KA161_12560 [Saprospiraceae bacterium]|nr:hypothetical protein [Saprospiraceae bacterium]
MKKYVRTVLSFMVMGLFLLMAVASLDPGENPDIPNDCEFLMPPQEKGTEITIIVKDNETNLPMYDARIKILLVKYRKNKKEDNTCEFKYEDLNILESQYTDNKGMYTFDFFRNYHSSEDYTLCTIYVEKLDYYIVHSNILITFESGKILEPFFLLKENKTP